MPAFIALLRGVNVGKANRVPMAAFRQLLEGLGYRDVVTLLNSGNAVFHAAPDASPKIAAGIGAALLQQLRVNVPVIVKSARELAAIVDACPIKVSEAGQSQMLVIFTTQPEALLALQAIEPLIKRPERFAIGEHAAYLHCAAGMLQSKAAAALLGRLGRMATTRNWTTTLKLKTLACPDS